MFLVQRKPNFFQAHKKVYDVLIDDRMDNWITHTAIKNYVPVTVRMKGQKNQKICRQKLRPVHESTYPREVRNRFHEKFHWRPSKKIDKTVSPWTFRYFNIKIKVQNEVPPPSKPSKVAYN